MGKPKELYRVLNRGGVVSPALFARILDVAEQAGNGHVFLGSRQDILFYIPDSKHRELSEEPGLSIHKRTSGIQNVVSSFVCVDVLPSTDWIYSGVYLKVFDQFSRQHLLRVNIVDPRQNMVPLFYGHLNFIASETPNYWRLFLNLQAGKDPQPWPGLIFTDDIAGFAQLLEQLILGKNIKNIQKLKEQVAGSSLQKNTLDSNEKISLPSGFFPYFEGLNKVDGKDRYWAGFYWRNNRYPIPFLKEVCRLCQETHVGNISFTPWKTILVKGIETNDKIFWEELVGRYGINMRHSSFELNWQLPLLDRQALELKRYLVAKFDKFDIRTFGLSFAIQTKPGERFTSVVIHPKGRLPFLGKFDFTRTYSVEYAYDFNPNNNHYIEYAGNLEKRELPRTLNEISKKYYALLFARNKSGKPRRLNKPEHIRLKVYQCPDCLTIYDERYGDLDTGIGAGTPFNRLPEDYCCPVCETPYSAFTEREINEPVNSERFE